MKKYDPSTLFELMGAANMDFPDLAREVRIRTGRLCTTQTVKRWTGETAPSADTLRALADVFHVPMEDFFSEESR